MSRARSSRSRDWCDIARPQIHGCRRPDRFGAGRRRGESTQASRHHRRSTHGGDRCAGVSGDVADGTRGGTRYVAPRASPRRSGHRRDRARIGSDVHGVRPDRGSTGGAVLQRGDRRARRCDSGRASQNKSCDLRPARRWQAFRSRPYSRQLRCRARLAREHHDLCGFVEPGARASGGVAGRDAAARAHQFGH